MSEKAIERQHVKEAKANGWLVRKAVFVGSKGAPDRMYIKNGRVVFLEWKAPKRGPTELQWSQIKELREAGVVAEYVDSIEIAHAVLNGHIHKASPSDRTYPVTRRKLMEEE